MEDVILHRTETKPSLRDRIKVLLGATIVIDSEIRVDKEVVVISSKANDKYIFSR